MSAAFTSGHGASTRVSSAAAVLRRGRRPGAARARRPRQVRGLRPASERAGPASGRGRRGRGAGPARVQRPAAAVPVVQDAHGTVRLRAGGAGGEGTGGVGGFASTEGRLAASPPPPPPARTTGGGGLRRGTGHTETRGPTRSAMRHGECGRVHSAQRV